MIRAEAFVQALCGAGFRQFTGTPCSYLTPLINRVIDSPDTEYIGAANEGDAVAIAAGAELGGRPGVALFQNSGLGNAVNPLTSLTYTFRIPILVITTWRAQPGGPADEPQHELMGRITPDLLALMGVPSEVVLPDEAALAPMLERATEHMRMNGTPYGLILPHGVVAPYALQTAVPRLCQPCLDLAPPARLKQPCHTSQDDALAAIRDGTGPSDALLATTGYTGRALYALGDRRNQFYMVGSMGCVSSLGLGLARAQAGRRVVVIDGDGAALMRLGALATIGHERPDNLVHVLLDNGVHDSTGAQPTTSCTADLAAAARACGYARVIRAAGADELRAVLRQRERGLSFVHIRTRPRDSRKLPRPETTPADAARRFRSWLKGEI